MSWGKKTIDKSKIKNILIRATNWVGDAVMMLPALDAVGENFPSSTITVMAKPWVAPLFEHHDHVHRLLVYNKGAGSIRDLREMLRAIAQIRKSRFDLAILFQNAFEAAFLAYFGGVRHRIGYDTDGRGLFLTHRIVRDEAVLKAHQVEYYLSILRAMGWQAASKDPKIRVGAEEMKKAVEHLQSYGIKTEDFLLVLSPGAIYGDAKRWPPDRFAKIGDWASERWGARVLIMGTQGEMDICHRVSDVMKQDPINLCGRTSLGEALGLIKQCHFFVTNDSGLMHIAAGLGIPTMAIFGSTDEVATGPRGPRTKIVKHEMDCAPCLKPECPIDHRCMLSIEPEEVWQEMERFKETLM